MALVVEIDEALLAAKFESILPHLDERQRRLVLGAEARSLGHGGVSLVARASGVSRVTVTAGVAELEAGCEPTPGRARRAGGGRKPLTSGDPGLLNALDALVEPETRGDPMTRLRWTTKSTRTLAEELTRQGHLISHHSVGRLLSQELDYSLQANAKTLEGAQHPDRDAQFRYIHDQTTQALGDGQPVISVDAKKKELIGQYANAGRTWRPKGDPTRVDVHDFPGPAGKAIPYGVYDLAANTGWVSVGQDGDTATSGRNDPPLVGHDRETHLPGCHPPTDHRRCRGIQRLPATTMEEGTGRPGPDHWPDHHGLSHAAGHQQMEQDRASAVQPYLPELGRTAPDQP
jgi:hypothetical protein